MATLESLTAMVAAASSADLTAPTFLEQFYADAQTVPIGDRDAVMRVLHEAQALVVPPKI